MASPLPKAQRAGHAGLKPAPTERQRREAEARLVSGGNGNGDNHNCEHNRGSRGDYGGGNDASRQNCSNIGKGSSKRSGLCGVKDYDGGGDSRDGGTKDDG